MEKKFEKVNPSFFPTRHKYSADTNLCLLCRCAVLVSRGSSYSKVFLEISVSKK